MYVVFGNKIIDSKEIGEIIEKNSEFKVLKDMAKGSKREDIIAFNLSISTKILNEIMEDDFDLSELSEDDFFD